VSEATRAAQLELELKLERAERQVEQHREAAEMVSQKSQSEHSMVVRDLQTNVHALQTGLEAHDLVQQAEAEAVLRRTSIRLEEQRDVLESRQKEELHAALALRDNEWQQRLKSDKDELTRAFNHSLNRRLSQEREHHTNAMTHAMEQVKALALQSETAAMREIEEERRKYKELETRFIKAEEEHQQSAARLLRLKEGMARSQLQEHKEEAAQRMAEAVELARNEEEDKFKAILQESMEQAQQEATETMQRVAEELKKGHEEELASSERQLLDLATEEKKRLEARLRAHCAQLATELAVKNEELEETIHRYEQERTRLQVAHEAQIHEIRSTINTDKQEEQRKALFVASISHEDELASALCSAADRAQVIVGETVANLTEKHEREVEARMKKEVAREVSRLALEKEVAEVSRKHLRSSGTPSSSGEGPLDVRVSRNAMLLLITISSLTGVAVCALLMVILILFSPGDSATGYRSLDSYGEGVRGEGRG